MIDIPDPIYIHEPPTSFVYLQVNDSQTLVNENEDQYDARDYCRRMFSGLQNSYDIIRDRVIKSHEKARGESLERS